MVTQKQLENLKRGRAIRKRNMELQKNPNQKQKKLIFVPRGRSVFVNPDLDVTRTDGGINENILAPEDEVRNINDFVPRALRGRR